MLVPGLRITSLRGATHSECVTAGVTNAWTDFDRGSFTDVGWRAARLAAQQKLGLLPNGRAGTGPHRRSRPASSWKNLSSATFPDPPRLRRLKPATSPDSRGCNGLVLPMCSEVLFAYSVLTHDEI